MPDIDPAIAQRISNAARALSIARHQLEHARDWKDRQALQANFDRAEQEMLDAAMHVNRGVSREANPA